MKKVATILGLVVAFGLMVQPASADGGQQASVDGVAQVTAGEDGSVTVETGEICKLQYPPECQVGPIHCEFSHPPSADDCDVDLSSTNAPIPPPCFVDEEVSAAGETVRVTVGYCG